MLFLAHLCSLCTEKQNLLIGLGIIGAGIGIYAISRAAKAVEWEPEEPLPELANLYGTVTDVDTGEPLSGAGIWVTGVSAFTDEKGRYILRNLVPGNYLLNCAIVGWQYYEGGVTVQKGNNKKDLALKSFLW